MDRFQTHKDAEKKDNTMIAEQYRKMLDAKSVIRQLSEKATKRAQIIGAENVFDYSLGNPNDTGILYCTASASDQTFSFGGGITLTLFAETGFVQ